MLIRRRILLTLAVVPLFMSASQASNTTQQLTPGDFITFILPDAGDHPEPRDRDVRLGVGGSAVEQPTDVLVYGDGATTAFAGRDTPGLCASGTVQTAELVDPEGKRPRRTISVITTHPNIAIPPHTRLEELQIFSKCLDAEDRLYIEYMGTLRGMPGESSAVR